MSAAKGHFCLALQDSIYYDLKNQRDLESATRRALDFRVAFGSVTADTLEMMVTHRRLQQECGLAGELGNGSTKELAGRLSLAWMRLLGDPPEAQIQVPNEMCD